MYLALIVVSVAAAAVLIYSFTLKPPEEITGVVWRRSGSFAGLDETLAIGSDGSAALSSNFLGEAEFTLTDAEWEELSALIAVSGFMEFDAMYRAKSRADAADYFSYSLTVEIDSTPKQVQWVDQWAAVEELPEGLEEIWEWILGITQGTGTGGVEGVVTDLSGNPLPGYSVSITRGSAGFPEIAAITGGDGHYSIGGVPPGVFTLGVRGESGELLAEDTVFMRGGEASRLDFSLRREVRYDHSGAVSLFGEGIHIIATDGDPTAPDVLEGIDIWNDYWSMLRDAST
jgi:hypothetical protein